MLSHEARRMARAIEALPEPEGPAYVCPVGHRTLPEDIRPKGYAVIGCPRLIAAKTQCSRPAHWQSEEGRQDEDKGAAMGG